jgi:hypothetical protein
VAEELDLGLVGQAALGGLADARARLGAFRDQRQGHEALRAVRAVSQPGRDLAVPVPGAQRGP